MSVSNKYKAKAMDKMKNYAAEALENLNFEIIGVELEGITREGLVFKAKLSVDNPLNWDIPTRTIAYTFKTNGRVIATGTIPSKLMKAKTKTTVEVPIEVAFKSLPNVGKELFHILSSAENWVIKYELELVLTFIGDLQIPLSIKGEKKIPTRSELGKLFKNMLSEKIKDATNGLNNGKLLDEV